MGPEPAGPGTRTGNAERRLMRAYPPIARKTPSHGAIRAGGNVVIVSGLGRTNVEFKQICAASQ
jgi:hypothetical protein